MRNVPLLNSNYSIKRQQNSGIKTKGNAVNIAAILNSKPIHKKEKKGISKSSLRECITIGPASVKEYPRELANLKSKGKTPQEQKAYKIKTMLLNSENRPPAYFIYNNTSSN